MGVLKHDRMVGVMVSVQDFEAMRVFYVDRLQHRQDESARATERTGLPPRRWTPCLPMRVETVHLRHKSLENQVVIDTNVWLSAALSLTGAPAQVVRRVLASGVPVFSDATFAELQARIGKPKFDLVFEPASAARNFA